MKSMTIMCNNKGQLSTYQSRSNHGQSEVRMDLIYRACVCLHGGTSKDPPACFGAMSRWLTLTPPSESADRPRPTVMSEEASAGEAPTAGETASSKQPAGPSIPTTCNTTRTPLTLHPEVIKRSASEHRGDRAEGRQKSRCDHHGDNLA